MSESLEEMLTRRQRELSVGTTPAPSLVERARALRDLIDGRSGEIACYCFALAVALYTFSLIAQLFVASAACVGAS